MTATLFLLVSANCQMFRKSSTLINYKVIDRNLRIDVLVSDPERRDCLDKIIRSVSPTRRRSLTKIAT